MEIGVELSPNAQVHEVAVKGSSSEFELEIGNLNNIIQESAVE